MTKTKCMARDRQKTTFILKILTNSEFSILSDHFTRKYLCVMNHNLWYWIPWLMRRNKTWYTGHFCLFVAVRTNLVVTALAGKYGNELGHSALKTCDVNGWKYVRSCKRLNLLFVFWWFLTQNKIFFIIRLNISWSFSNLRSITKIIPAQSN